VTAHVGTRPFFSPLFAISPFSSLCVHVPRGSSGLRGSPRFILFSFRVLEPSEFSYPKEVFVSDGPLGSPPPFLPPRVQRDARFCLEIHEATLSFFLLIQGSRALQGSQEQSGWKLVFGFFSPPRRYLPPAPRIQERFEMVFFFCGAGCFPFLFMRVGLKSGALSRILVPSR